MEALTSGEIHLLTRLIAKDKAEANRKARREQELASARATRARGR